MLRFEKLPKADDFYGRELYVETRVMINQLCFPLVVHGFIWFYKCFIWFYMVFNDHQVNLVRCLNMSFWVSVSSICSTLQENVILQWMTRKQTYFSAGNLHWITNALGTSLIYLDLPLLQVVGPWYTQVILFMKIWACINYDSLKPCKSCDIILMELALNQHKTLFVCPLSAVSILCSLWSPDVQFAM